MTLLRVKVVANAKSFSASFEEGVLKVRVSSAAREGKANEELARKLSKLLGTKVAIVRGLKSREKEIIVEKLSEKEVVEKVNVPLKPKH